MVAWNSLQYGHLLRTGNPLPFILCLIGVNLSLDGILTILVLTVKCLFRLFHGLLGINFYRVRMPAAWAFHGFDCQVGHGYTRFEYARTPGMFIVPLSATAILFRATMLPDTHSVDAFPVATAIQRDFISTTSAAHTSR